jgi:glycosyltransferase involved in cell wall biosynthesis
MVATPGDGSCGIGTYARDLRDGLGSVTATTVSIPQDDRSVLQFCRLAIDAVRASGQVIHVQHEYGLFRREGSPYPGVMGFVFFPLLFVLGSVRSREVVITMHSVIDFDPDEASFPVRLSLLLMHKLLVLGSSNLIFLSPDCAGSFRRQVALDERDYSVLSHGVKTDLPTTCSQAEARRDFGYDPDDTIVAIPGFIRPPKGHDIFLEVAHRLPEYEFLIAGGARPKGEDFEFANQIREAAPENVRVAGVLDEEDFWAALALPDLGLLPYRVVTQSGTFNCCASQELPVLSSDAEYFSRLSARWGVPETVRIDDVEEVTERLRRLLEDDERRERLSTAMSHYKRANSFEAVGLEHVRIYRGVVAGTPPTIGEGTTRSEQPTSAPARAACSAQRSVVT